MKVANVRLLQEPDKSFIYYKENNPFTTWHYHPEIELCLITKGQGKRMIGDNIDRFKENDLTLIGANTPHEFLCDSQYYSVDGGFSGEGIVIQFLPNFLGEKFLNIPENKKLKNFIFAADMGYSFFGKTKRKIIALMLKMKDMDEIDKLYSLFSIFRIFASTKEYKILSSPAYSNPFWQEEHNPMQKALKFIMQNFQGKIYIKDLLQITSMSNSTFYATFKKTYRMSFKEYLLNIRIGYACKLLTDPTQSISCIAYESGFENISNFNRQFKKIKGITPSEFVRKIKDMEVLDND